MGDQEDLRREENGVEVDEEDEEPCVETGRSLINALLEDSEGPMVSDFVEDSEESDAEEEFAAIPSSSDINEEIGAVVKTEECENGVKMQIWADSLREEEYNFEEEAPGPSSIDEAIAAVAGTSMDHLDAQNLPLPYVGDRSYSPPDIFMQVKNEDDQTSLEAMNAADFMTEMKPGPSSPDGPPPPKKSMDELTDLWIRENCICEGHYCMPRGEIYAVYVDDLRSKYDSTSHGIAIFCQYMSDIFPSVTFRRSGFLMEAVGVRLAKTHSLAPSSSKWEQPAVIQEPPADEEMSDEEDEEGEEEGSPVERLTMRWIKLNCIEDETVTTPRGELYAAYIDDLRNEHCTLSGSLRLFGNVMKRVFPFAQIRKRQVLVNIKGVKYVGPHRLHRTISKRWRTNQGKLTNSILEAKLDGGFCDEDGGDGDTNSMDYGDNEPGYSGAFDAEQKGVDSAEIEKPFSCGECPKTFADSFSLTIHRGTHTRERRSRRLKELQSALQLEAHTSVDDGSSAEHPDPLSINVHSVKPTFHQGIKAYACPICGRLCCAPSTLQAHLRVHTHKPTECPVCEKKFKTPSALNGHMRAHGKQKSPKSTEEIHPEIALVKPFQCELCGSRFMDDFNLTIHKYRHSREQGLLQEPSIEENDLDVKDVVALEPTDNSDPTDSRVPTVGSYLNQIYNPKSSFRAPRNETPPSFTCEICNMKSQTAANLKIHMRKHTGEKPFKCDLCPKKFTSKGILKVHRVTHLTKKHQCSVCSKRFKWKSEMKAHLKKH